MAAATLADLPTGVVLGDPRLRGVLLAADPENQTESTPAQPASRGAAGRRAASRKRTQEAVDGPAGVGEAESTQLAPIDEVGLAPIEGNPTYTVSRRSRRDRVAEWVLLRSQGMKNVDIAAKMGIQASSLNTLISKSVREGWLIFESPADRLEYELAPKVVDNIKHFLDEKDKQVTLETAKGLGLFKTHQALKVEGDGAPAVIAIKIDMIEPSIARAGGVIVGTPKLPTLAGTVVKPE